MPSDERQPPHTDALEDDGVQDAGPPADDARVVDDDPLRVIRLMWAPPAPPRRGPKPKISLDAIVAAAIRVADAHGVDGLSMRAVAGELDVGAMSLYTYVRSKDDLLDLMVDAAFAARRLPAADLEWRTRLRALAEADWATYHRHPWLLRIDLARSSWGPNVMDGTESLYATLAAAGLAPRRIVEVANVYEAFVQGAARTSVIDRDTERASGLSYLDHMTARLGFFESLFDGERFPHHVAIYERGGFDETTPTFEFGTRLLVAAVEAMRAERP